MGGIVPFQSLPPSHRGTVSCRNTMLTGQLTEGEAMSETTETPDEPTPDGVGDEPEPEQEPEPEPEQEPTQEPEQEPQPGEE